MKGFRQMIFMRIGGGRNIGRIAMGEKSYVL